MTTDKSLPTGLTWTISEGNGFRSSVHVIAKPNGPASSPSLVDTFLVHGDMESRVFNPTELSFCSRAIPIHPPGALAASR
jgi:hypothetical protein